MYWNSVQSQRTMSLQNWLAENFSRMTTAAAADKNRAGHLHPADAVIHRQAVVHPVCRLRVHHAGKPVAPLHDAGMADVGGFGQSGCAGGVDVERPILDGQRPPLVSTQRFARLLLDVAIDTRKRGVLGAVDPDRSVTP